MITSTIINNHDVKLIKKGNVIYFSIFDICIASGIDINKTKYPINAYCDINTLWEILREEGKYDIWKQCKALKPLAAPGPYSIISHKFP
jgi:hypothetical protein